MTITCEQLDDLLLEGDPCSLQAAARHAQSCPDCMQKLYPGFVIKPESTSDTDK